MKHTRKFLDSWVKPLYLKDGKMTEERFNELSPEEWSEYKFGGQYLKLFYDIEISDGRIFLDKYPNAGQFRIGDEIILVKDIVKFRLSKGD